MRLHFCQLNGISFHVVFVDTHFNLREATSVQLEVIDFRLRIMLQNLLRCFALRMFYQNPTHLLDVILYERTSKNFALLGCC